MVYLDSAATTLQKPPEVARAVQWAVGHLASPGRGGHRAAMLAAEKAFQCRQEAARLFHLSQPENVIFTLNATHALNTAIYSVIKPGDAVVVSGYEHNAVMRPLHALGCKIKVARAPLFAPQAMVEAFESLLTEDTACVICTHVSNVFGYILPVGEIAQLCQSRGIPMILDASQSAGVLPVHMDELGCAFIGMPGHKGLYGPQGTGLLLCREGQPTQPLLSGGTGSQSVRQEMPDFLPDRLEAGTHNMVGISGLLEGMRYVQSKGEETIRTHEAGLTALAVKGLRQLDPVTVYAAREPQLQSGVLSLQVRGMDCEEVGERLGQRGIAVRAGLHCAPCAHETVGTLERGTVRVSFSAFNTAADVNQLLRALREIAK